MGIILQTRVWRIVNLAEHSEICDVGRFIIAVGERTGVGNDWKWGGGQRATVSDWVRKSEGPDKESGHAMEGCGVGILAFERNMGMMGILGKFLFWNQVDERSGSSII